MLVSAVSARASWVDPVAGSEGRAESAAVAAWGDEVGDRFGVGDHG